MIWKCDRSIILLVINSAVIELKAIIATVSQLPSRFCRRIIPIPDAVLKSQLMTSGTGNVITMLTVLVVIPGFDFEFGGSRKNCQQSRDDRIPPQDLVFFLHCKSPKHCPWLLSRPKAYAFPGLQPKKCSLQGHGTMSIGPCFQ